MNDPSTFLRNVLRGNALFSLVSGLAFALFYQPIGHFIGIKPLIITLVTGLILIGFSGLVWFAAGRESISRKLVWLIIDLDLLWVIGTVIMLIAGGYTYAGSWIMGLLSLVVLDFAVAQFIGLRRLDPKTEIANN